MNFKVASLDMESLAIGLNNLRDKLCLDSVEKAKVKCQELGIHVERRIRRRPRMPGELARDAGLSAEQEVTVTRVVKNAIDRFRQELQNRFCRLKDLNSKFGFLHDISDLLRDRNEKELKALRSDCTQFGSFYDTDVDGEELYNEIINCKM